MSLFIVAVVKNVLLTLRESFLSFWCFSIVGKIVTFFIEILL